MTLIRFDVLRNFHWELIFSRWDIEVQEFSQILLKLNITSIFSILRPYFWKFWNYLSTIRAKYKPSFRLEIYGFDFSMKVNVSTKEWFIDHGSSSVPRSKDFRTLVFNSCMIYFRIWCKVNYTAFHICK